MSLPFLSSEHVEAFILVFLRVGAIIVTIPVISDTAVPLRVKAALTILISLIIFPLVLQYFPKQESYQVLIMTFKMAGEIFIGVIIGYSARFVFAGIQMAGDIIGYQMGLSMANVIDPMTNQQVSTIAELQYLMAMLVFLIVDAHHFFFSAIVQSYSIVSPLTFHFSGQLMQKLFEFSQEIFIIAVKLGAPLIAVMLFTNVGLGIVARTVPQMNIFIVGFPLQIGIGLIFLGLTAPLLVKMTQTLFAGLELKIVTLLRLM